MAVMIMTRIVLVMMWIALSGAFVGRADRSRGCRHQHG
jgi:hypothetical protein